MSKKFIKYLKYKHAWNILTDVSKNMMYNTILYFLNSLLVAKIRVRIGEWDFSSTSEPLSNIERKIAKKIVHPKYNFFTYENDLALLKLDKRIDFQDNIIPICLPANDDLLIGNLFFCSYFYN